VFLCKQVLKDQVGFIATSGITSVWLPPPSDSVSPQGYLPRDLYNLNSAYGSEAELRECLNTLHDYDLKAIADIVINHRCAHFQVRNTHRLL
jgi:alpha-amylase